MAADLRLLVTGGAGFIGTAVVRDWVAHTGADIVVLDKLTYAGHPANLAGLPAERVRLVEGDVCDAGTVAGLFSRFRPTHVMHLAAESHVDRSISGPDSFITTNILGTFVLLEAALAYWSGLDPAAQAAFRFHHVSTDEVYGSLGAEGRFSEDSQYQPNSPYSASKASADHLVRAWHHTYGLPVLVTNCTNNYGPYQFPEKLIPLMVTNALAGRPLPVYGQGSQMRDWLYVEDHAEALRAVLQRGRVGEVYCVGGDCERVNLDLVRTLCAILDEEAPAARPYAELIAFVPDRPGHDARYAMDIAKIGRELGWRPRESLASGLRKTVRWYLDHAEWVALRLDAARRWRAADAPAALAARAWNPDGVARLEGSGP